MIVDGLQTRGLFALHCAIQPESIAVGRLWLRDSALLGQTVSLVQSDGDNRYAVRLPDSLPFPADNVSLTRV